MIRDGVDDPLMTECRALCAACSTICRRKAIEMALRKDGWRPISTAEISGHAPIDILNRDGRKVRALYDAHGDYRDRWKTEDGKPLSPTHWRVVRALVSR